MDISLVGEVGEGIGIKVDVGVGIFVGVGVRVGAGVKLWNLIVLGDVGAAARTADKGKSINISSKRIVGIKNSI